MPFLAINYLITHLESKQELLMCKELRHAQIENLTFQELPASRKGSFLSTGGIRASLRSPSLRGGRNRESVQEVRRCVHLRQSAQVHCILQRGVQREDGIQEGAQVH